MAAGKLEIRFVLILISNSLAAIGTGDLSTANTTKQKKEQGI